MQENNFIFDIQEICPGNYILTYKSSNISGSMHLNTKSLDRLYLVVTSMFA